MPDEMAETRHALSVHDKKIDDIEEIDGTETNDDIDTSIFEEALNEFKSEIKSKTDGEKDGETAAVLESDGGSGEIDKTESEEKQEQTVETEKPEQAGVEHKPDDELIKTKQALVELQAKLAAEAKKNADIEAIVKANGIDSKGNIAAAIEAMQTGEDINVVIARRNQQEAAARAALENMPEYQEFLKEKRQKDLDRIYTADLEAVKKYDSTVTAGNIKDIPNYQDFAKYRAKGYDVEAAYKLANFDSLTAKKAQAKAENIASKDHLKPVGGHGGGNSEDNITIPRAELLELRDVFPGESDAKLRERYIRIQKLQAN